MKTRISTVLQGLAALLALVAIEAGIPLGLAQFGTLPHQLPSLTQASSALTSPDNGSLLLGAITLIGWLAWGAFTYAVLIESAAALRHRGAPRIRTLGTLQHLAAGLVASIILLLPATGAMAASAAPAAAATLHLPHATPLSPATAAHQATRACTAEHSWNGPVHHVASSDETLWDLAQQYLGDGMRWSEIAQLNQGTPQSDGTTLTASTLQLTPGWTLRLPADARTVHHATPTKHTEQAATTTHRTTAPQHTPPGDTAMPGHRTERMHLVLPGETLSQIAQDDLGSASDYPELAAANTHVVQSDGRHLTDPDLIYPGWKLTIPQANAGTSTLPTPPPGTTAGTGTGTGTGSGTAGPGSGATPTVPPPTAAPTTPAAPAPSTAAPTTSAPSPSPTTTAEPSATATAVPALPTTAPPIASAPVEGSEASMSAQVGAGIAALLAGGLLAGYGVKRALQQRRRRPGETIAVPAQTSALEHALVHQGDPPSAELLDRALRTLANLLPAGTDAPQLNAARFTTAGIQLHTDGQPLPPFTTGPDGWWQLDPAHALLSAEEAAKVDAPYPMLATLGVQPEQGLLLADLATARTVLLDGPVEQVREIARSLALETATSPWGDDLTVLCVGITDPDLPEIVHTGRMQHLRQLGDAVKDLAELLLTAHQDAETPQPWLLVVADRANEQDAWQIADLLARVPGAPIALVLPGHGLHALFPDALHLDCASTDPQPSPVPGAPLVLQRVTETAYQQLLADLRTTEQPAIPAAGSWVNIPASPDTLEEEPVEEEPVEEEALLTPPTGGAAAEGVSPYLAFTQHRPSPAPSGSGAVPLLPTARAAITVQIPEVPGQGDVLTPALTTMGTAVPAEPVASFPQPDTQGSATVPGAPEIMVLGPLDVTGLGSSGRGRRVADLAAFLYLHPHRTAEAIATAMNAMEPWEHRTVVNRMSDLRKLLGTAPDGTPYLPRVARNATYPKLTGVACDWTRFLRLTEQGLLAGPAGVADLEAALRLVRGRPFQGSNASWAVPEEQEMVSRIVDVAHATAVHRTTTRDWDAARRAIRIGLDVEPTAEILFRDWIVLEYRRGNHAELSRVITELQKALRPLKVDMEPATEKLITNIYARDQRGNASTNGTPNVG